MKPSDMMVHYRDALVSIEQEPEQWLSMFQRKLADCKDPLAKQLLTAGAARCQRHIDAKKKAK